MILRDAVEAAVLKQLAECFPKIVTVLSNEAREIATTAITKAVCKVVEEILDPRTYVALRAERDALKAEVGRLNQERMDVLSFTLKIENLEAEVGRLRAAVGHAAFRNHISDGCGGCRAVDAALAPPEPQT